MDKMFYLGKSLCVLLIWAQMLGLTESGVLRRRRRRPDVQVILHGNTSTQEGTSFVSRKGRQASFLPEERLNDEYSLFHVGGIDRIDMGRLNQGFGGFNSFSQPRQFKKDHKAQNQRRFGRFNSSQFQSGRLNSGQFQTGQFNSSQFQSGRFNSETHGCRGIQVRSCSGHGHCAGCLGLYTCDVQLGKCQMKGLSQRTESKFFQTLRDARHR